MLGLWVQVLLRVRVKANGKQNLTHAHATEDVKIAFSAGTPGLTKNVRMAVPGWWVAVRSTLVPIFLIPTNPRSGSGVGSTGWDSALHRLACRSTEMESKGEIRFRQTDDHLHGSGLATSM